MRKICVVLALFLYAFMLAACGSGGSIENDEISGIIENPKNNINIIVGTWVPERIEAGGESLSIDEYAEMAGASPDALIEFKGDGTFAIVAGGETGIGDFSLSGDLIQMNDDVQTTVLSLADEKIILDIDGGRMIFARK